MKYVLSLKSSADTDGCFYIIDLKGEDLKAEEHYVMQKAKELYRDAMNQRGLWPRAEYNGTHAYPDEN